MATTAEIFANIPLEGYENYQVSNYGKIMNLKTKRVIASYPDKDGYQVISIRVGTIVKQVKVHRLVCTAFHDNPLGKPCVNHIDGVKDNNYYENVEWCTYKENMHHASVNNLLADGERHPQAKLTAHAVQLIREDLKRNLTIVSIAADFGVGATTISNIKYNLRWKKVPLID